jgi:hypothetical protein
MPFPDDPADDELEIEIRPLDQIAARLVILAAVVRRAILELPLDGALDDDSPEGRQFDMMIALEEEPLAAHVTDAERAILSTPVGSLGEWDALALSWQIEALAAVASLTIPGVALSEPWVQANAGPLLAAIPQPWDDLQAFTSKLARPIDDESAFERERAELWAWRVAIDDDLAILTGRRRAELLADLEETVTEGVEAGLLPSGQRDFAVASQPFSALDPETKALIAEISIQRLTALNWLCGFGDSWDTVPLDV